MLGAEKTRVTRVRERLQSARELLGQGRTGEAERLVEDVLRNCAGLPEEDLACSCGLSARLLALRGERERAGLLAEIAVRLAHSGTPRPCQADALLDQAYTLRTLGDREEADACLRAARALSPRPAPAAALTW
ncbi:hypothetical protein [Streptacidiphilus sp. P02-A3a]|uniref:hypothetical protein n=1 Tax=Streptacidiphilus sp. P02-A3a TaxID=2704468 RepID=UPI0015F891D6|nr:hypothetical protein [Streptacidiphilus sp. P02-A3a]QMU73254.1 hypothetical protein GXP74_38510 [Streptacidiphilus sp. P02-A3a]